MKRPLAFRAAAQAEFEESAAWYEKQQSGLGTEFVEEVQRVLENIAAKPKKYAIAFDDIREAPVRRFPFCVYYRVRRDRVVIIASFMPRATQPFGGHASER
jgi:plasmid stabilization system protein ParE